MKRLVILVTGSRDATDEHRVAITQALDEAARSSRRELHLVTGCADGVDAIAAEWAGIRGCIKAVFRADWTREGRAAGPKRNANMVAYVCEQRDKGDQVICLAFPATDKPSKGTRGCMALAKQAGIAVREFPLTVAAGDRERV